MGISWREYVKYGSKGPQNPLWRRYESVEAARKAYNQNYPGSRTEKWRLYKKKAQERKIRARWFHG